MWETYGNCACHEGRKNWEERLARIEVKDGASIGANATIIAGVVISNYAMVGADSVVTRDVPDHGLVFGNPASLRGFVCTCGMQLQERERGTNYLYVPKLR